MICARTTPLMLQILVAGAVGSSAAACVPPERSFLPQSPDDMRAYADLIRGDFEAYIAEVQEYFQCLDVERARAFAEAREVSEDYARFVGAVR